jgi:hypothetical protein
MDEATREAVLNMPAMEPPDGVEPNFSNPSNRNDLANGVAISCLVLTTLAFLVRAYSWPVALKQWVGRIEACECRWVHLE